MYILSIYLIQKYNNIIFSKKFYDEFPNVVDEFSSRHNHPCQIKNFVHGITIGKYCIFVHLAYF